MSLVQRTRTRLGRIIRSAGTDTAARERLDRHDQALHDITAALQQVQARVPEDLRDRLDRHLATTEQVEAVLPSLLNTIASAHGQQRGTARQLGQVTADLGYRTADIDDLKRQVVELWDRLEKSRAELLYELRYQSTQSSPAGANAPDPAAGAAASLVATIVDSDAVETRRAAGDLRLNVGCGHQPLDHYLNVDMRELPDVDIVATVDDLPFEAGELAEIYSSHVVEHFPQEQLERALLPYWFGLLRPGGEFRAVVPDAGAMLAGFAAGDVSYDDLREVTFGGQEYEGDFHFNFYTTDSLAALLEAAGFDEIEVEASGRRNGKCLEFQIVARKPG